jgi:hypothetical protein
MEKIPGQSRLGIHPVVGEISKIKPAIVVSIEAISPKTAGLKIEFLRPIFSINTRSKIICNRIALIMLATVILNGERLLVLFMEVL